MTKKTYILGGLVALCLLVGGLFWLFCRDEGDAYVRALPEDVTLVGRVNAQELVLQNGLKLADLPRLLSDTDQSGVDYGQTGYFFAFQSYYGLLLPLEDTEGFLQAMAPHHSGVERQRGFSWTTLDGTFLLAADDEKALIVGPATGAEQETLRNTLYTCMTQKTGGNASPLFKALGAQKAPVALAANWGVLPEQFRSVWAAGMPKEMLAEDLVLTAGLAMRRNELTLDLQLQAEDDQANAYLDSLDEVLKPLDGSLLPTAPANPFFHIEAGLRGGKLIELLRKNPATRTQLLGLNMLFDLDMILKSIDGNVALTMPKFALLKQNYLLQARVTDDGFMKNVASWNDGPTYDAGVQFLPARNDMYLCAFKGSAYYFGVRDQRLLVSTDESLLMPIAPYETQVDPEAQGARLYARVDLSWLMGLQALLPQSDRLPQFQRLTLACREARHWQLKLRASEGTDLLKTILKK